MCCSQIDEKVNVTWNSNHTVTYRTVRRWYFDPENSDGSLNDSVTMLNVVPVVRQDVSYPACYVIFVFPNTSVTPRFLSH
jgi:hypothetical protein